MRDLPPHMTTPAWIESEIRYESAPGIHTYHRCECGRGLCRSVMCAECWREVKPKPRRGGKGRK